MLCNSNDKLYDYYNGKIEFCNYLLFKKSQIGFHQKKSFVYLFYLIPFEF